MRLFLVRHGQTQANIDGVGAYSIVDNHVGFITLRVFNARTEYWLDE
ncbi:hypothetical protein [Xenorhabdus japonica]|uniref:Phosphoglycerate mutase n=1 Tax=Xenorhabdus japonica TaxID=53341 RepID=A0A1I5AV46_9GAMM|nr:hypothetical protein [Xenorhabdus japonica]SFN66314.1 hypothetical protein SAMN05421579_11427 [Xenorhabdus japonica]